MVRAEAWKVGHDFLVIPGAERMRKALSTRCQCCACDICMIVVDVPLFRLLYTNSTTTSISFTAAPLKCLRTFMASCSLLTRLLSFRLAIVGDCLPMPGFTNSAWLSGDVKAAGVERWCETRYVFSRDNGVVFHAIYTNVSFPIQGFHMRACAQGPIRLTPGPSLPPASALTAANSFSAMLPLSLVDAAAAAAAVCLLFLACAAAAICRSRTVEASERESSTGTTFFAGGITRSCDPYRSRPFSV